MVAGGIVGQRLINHIFIHRVMPGRFAVGVEKHIAMVGRRVGAGGVVAGIMDDDVLFIRRGHIRMIRARRVEELRDDLGLRFTAAADGIRHAVGQPVRRRRDHRRNRRAAERNSRVIADDGGLAVAQLIAKPLRVAHKVPCLREQAVADGIDFINENFSRAGDARLQPAQRHTLGRGI